MPNIKKTWTATEDVTLTEAVARLGQTGWSNFSNVLPGRTGKQCRDRWYNHLRPMVKKGDWTPTEDKILFEAQKLYGNCWSKIAKEFLPGRTDLSVKNRYYSYMRKLARRRKRNKLQSIPHNQVELLGGKRKADTFTGTESTLAVEPSSKRPFTLPLPVSFSPPLQMAQTPPAIGNTSLLSAIGLLNGFRADAPNYLPLNLNQVLLQNIVQQQQQQSLANQAHEASLNFPLLNASRLFAPAQQPNLLQTVFPGMK